MESEDMCGGCTANIFSLVCRKENECLIDGMSNKDVARVYEWIFSREDIEEMDLPPEYDGIQREIL